MNSPRALRGKVLPTLNEDGSRLRIRPKLFRGRIERRRFYIGWSLIALFVALPWIHLGGKPLFLLDLPAREFTLFGRTFFATDGMLLMLLLLSIFIFIIWQTALLGRAWCGYGCPQTVYMELLFRPVERWFEGDRNAQLKLDREGGGRARVLKNLVFFVLSVLVANVFLSYFVGVKTLGHWMMASPVSHPAGFVVMAVTAGLVFFDFAFFREQMCTVICPYARLQSALLDKDSLIIAYDEKRGEPRRKGKPGPGRGDCVDCSACVIACPTGIDIREGLQLECIACGQCVDACNTIMPKVGRPLDLVGYASQKAREGGKSRLLRPRVIIYSALLLLLTVSLGVALSLKKGADLTVLRGIGAPYVLDASGVRNQFRIKVENREAQASRYQISVVFPRGDKERSAEEAGVTLVIPENPMAVEGRGRRTTTLFATAPRTAFERGKLPVLVRVHAENGEVLSAHYTLLGP